MTQGDQKFDALTDEEFVAWYVEHHGIVAARAMAKVWDLPLPKPGWKPYKAMRAGVKPLKRKRPKKPTRRTDEFDRLRHGEPPPRLLSNRDVKPRRAS